MTAYVPFTEAEKEYLYSGRVVKDVIEFEEIISTDPRPRKHVRLAACRIVIIMDRINNLLDAALFSTHSLVYAKESVLGKGGSDYMKKSERVALLRDLHEFRTTVSCAIADLNSSIGLRTLLQPRVDVFGSDGSVRSPLRAAFQAAGAKTITVLHDPSTLTKRISVKGTASPGQFKDTISNLCQGFDQLDFEYEQVTEGHPREEAGTEIQMGVWIGPR